MAAPAKKTVELFYDVVSPYTWIGFEVMCRYRTRWNIDLKLKPFFLGGVMQGAGNKPPGIVPNKAKYMMRDLERLGDYYGVPIKIPTDPFKAMFETGSLSAQRFITAVDMQNPQFTEAVSRELWMKIWSKDESIATNDSFIEAGQKAGLDDTSINNALSKLKDQTVKDRLKDYTQQALDQGAFGSPTIIAHVNGKKEMVFGSDRFPVLAMILGEKWEGPLKDGSNSKL